MDQNGLSGQRTCSAPHLQIIQKYHPPRFSVHSILLARRLHDDEMSLLYGELWRNSADTLTGAHFLTYGELRRDGHVSYATVHRTASLGLTHSVLNPAGKLIWQALTSFILHQRPHCFNMHTYSLAPIGLVSQIRITSNKCWAICPM